MAGRNHLSSKLRRVPIDNGLHNRLPLSIVSNPSTARRLYNPSTILGYRSSMQHLEIESLLLDNQQFAATHVALKQQLALAQEEIGHLLAADVSTERDDQVQKVFDRSLQMDAEVQWTDALREELVQVRMDVEKHVDQQELTSELRVIKGDHVKGTETQEAPAIKAEIAIMQQEIQRGRFNDETLLILESFLVCKDVKSLMEVQSSLREFMRSKSLCVMREIREKSVEDKLRILEFFVRAFALLGDIESCLALKYEALLFREVKSTSCQCLQVSYMEWLNFAEHLLDNGFYHIARQACENSLLCLQKDAVANTRTGEFCGDQRIKRLREYAVKFAASSSVQAKATEYLKRKRVENTSSSFNRETQFTANILFRNGIKKRNVRQLRDSQRLQQRISI